MLLVESQAGVIRLTLNRPERRNALSEAMLTELEAASSASPPPVAASWSWLRRERSFLRVTI